MSNAQRIAAFGKTRPSGVSHQFAMKILRRPIAESPLQQNLPRGGFQQISSADDLGNPHGRVIDDDRQLIRRHIVPSPNEKITNVASREISLYTQVQICKGNLFALIVSTIRVSPTGRNAKSPVRPGRAHE